jgi:glycosyltransferase involved in cell wall biosynthesis
MKVTLINTADSGGGAAVACKRLLKALQGKVLVEMLVQSKKTNIPAIISILKNKIDFWIAQIHSLQERIPFIAFYEKDKSVRFAFSTASAGTDISRNENILAADILHLHWVNHGFLSINNIKSIFNLNKPIVWTLHDMWLFTGGCHYAGKCEYFREQCGNCKFLRNPCSDDISHKGWLLKQNIFQQNNKMVLVACSNWMAQMAKRSSLLKGFRIEVIPNPIDTELYKPLYKSTLRKKWGVSADDKIVLFGAANINDKRKGIKYLVDALHILKEEISQNTNIKIVLFGKNNSLDISTFPFAVKSLPIITSELDLVEIYNLADVFVLPSLEDNLPNMIMEALSCGIPVVAFNQGGIPEMIDHRKNGFIAEYKSAHDLAIGIDWVLNCNYEMLKANAREKVLKNYSENLIAEKYIQVYHSILN